jgi:hypothetical protein
MKHQNSANFFLSCEPPLYCIDKTHHDTNYDKGLPKNLLEAQSFDPQSSGIVRHFFTNIVQRHFMTTSTQNSPKLKVAC